LELPIHIGNRKIMNLTSNMNANSCRIAGFMTSNSGMEVATLVHFSFLAYVDGNVMFGHLALNCMVKCCFML
jgi:hypothetical protein